ncbi:ATP-binding cassette domain-containing protein, partial [Treponema pedis]|uniref:ATP-binding cassette domain-containing protein n=1 Tax=Treponema pedis TaxID=409322 RepID=UPI0004636557
FVLIFILKTIQTAVSTGILYFFGFAIDEFTKNPSSEKIKLILIYALFELIFVAVHHICQRGVFFIRKKFALLYGQNLFESIFDIPPEDFLQNGTDYYFTAFKDQMPKVQSAYLLGRIHIASSFIGILLTVYVLASFHFSLPIVMVSSFVIGKCITKLIEPQVDKLSLQEITLQEEYNAKTSENQKGLPFYILNGKRDILFNRQVKANTVFENQTCKIEIRKTAFEWVMILTSMFLASAGLAFAIFLFTENKITIGMLGSTILYMNIFSQKFEELLNLFIEVRYGKVNKEKIDDIIKSKKNKIVLPEDKFKTLELHDVSFSYKTKEGQQKQVLKNINLRINKGDKILLKGKSGSGKSTLIKIILNLLKPDAGAVYFNDKKILNDEYAPFYFINQNFHLFNTSIEDNIFFGNKKQKEPYLFSRLENFFHNDVKALNSEGIEISGGEKERTALARVFAGSYKNIIMDETFAGLDFKNYKFIQNKFLDDNEITYIEISHREIDISKFDYIFNLEGGALYVTAVK